MPSFIRKPTRAAYAKQRTRIKRCRGTVCFEEIVRLFGTRSSNRMEILIDEYIPLRDEDGRKIWSGKYRKWPNGSIPSYETVKNIDRRAEGKSQLGHWRNLLLWYLVEEPFRWDVRTVHLGMTTLSVSVRKLLFLVPPDSHGRHTRRDLSREQTLELRDLHTLDAFMGLLALAREGELIQDDRQHALSAICAFEIFPRIVLAHSHLYACWEELYRCLEFAFWSRVYLENTYPRFSMSIARRHLEALRNDPHARSGINAGWREKSSRSRTR